MPTQTMAFISYRRSDSMQAAQGLRVQLWQRFGPGRTFMDVSGVSAGDVWPERLRRGMRDATVMLAVIGPSWLTAADQYGRRRLDQTGDWVRLEVCAAIEAKTPIIPLLVGGLQHLPEREGLPAELHAILDRQSFSLRDDRWDDDVSILARTLVDEFGFVDAGESILMPARTKTVSPLTSEQLDERLAELPGWEPVESTIPRDYPKTRQELRKAFRFRSFKRAVAFMAEAVAPINALKHHPRWENQWRTVIVYLSTWDIGNRISIIDVELAHVLDALYARFEGSAGA